MMEAFAEYGHAIVALTGTVIFGLILGPLSALRKSGDAIAPGSQPPADYSNATYRWHRAYSNLAENIGFFATVVLAAMVAGVNPFYVNLLASMYFVSRLVLAFVHIKGIGRPEMGVRSFTYVAGWMMCLILAGMTMMTVF